MGYIEAAVLGLVQGLCEFLPVSSSGHLVIFQTLFGLIDPEANLLYDVMLHLATLIAVFIAFRKRILKLIIAVFTMLSDIFRGRFSFKKASGDQRMVVFVIIATLPLFLFVPFKGYIELLFSSLLLVGVALLVTSLLLAIAFNRTRRASRRGRHTRGQLKNVYGKTPETMTAGDSLVIGLFQAVALTPGLSRSGATISGGLFRGLSRESAVEFSFIMSIPAILGSAVLQVGDALEAVPTAAWGPFLAGMAVALLSGLAAIKLISFLIKKDRFDIFAYYCAAAGIFAIVYSLLK